MSDFRRRQTSGAIAVMVLLLGSLASSAAADTRTGRDLERRFADTVLPFLKTYCVECHGGKKREGKLDLLAYSTPEAVANGYRQWEVVLNKLKGAEMPPEEADRQPAAEVRQAVIDWIQALRKHEAQRNAGDPGLVLARRLSNAEYDYTIRDLTGVDLRPAREFPVDPANEAGFDNSGESLTMSPALVKKQLDAARRVAEHVVLKPEGFVFAPHPAVTETDRDKFCVKRIMDFYQRQPTNYADYFMAAWLFQHRAVLRQPKASLAEMAAARQVSPKYLVTIWSVLTNSQETIGPIAALRRIWQELPTPGSGDVFAATQAARRGCGRMCDFVLRLRDQLKPDVKNLAVRGIAAGSQPLVLWKDRQLAANRTRYEPSALRIRDGLNDSAESLVDPALAAPDEPSARTRYEAAVGRFCRVFPDAFYVSERVLIFLKEDKDSRGRLLSAGFHLMTGYFRDDAPLSDLILDPSQRRELDQLWEEFHFITQDAARQYKDFIFFERAEPPRFAQGAEFDFARSEDKDVTSDPKIRQFAELYLAKARLNGAQGAALKAIEDYFESISADIRRVEQSRAAAEPSHLRALQTLAERAYRRPLSRDERAEVITFYRALRTKDGLDHEEAVRDTIVSILVSPYFCYRVQPPSGLGPPASRRNVRPLSDDALASRLSYFLWSSMPDTELLSQASAKNLHRPRVLASQARRMLQDDRARALGVEFAGQWLDIRRFEEHNAVDRERFKTFNSELRTAMFEEPVRFFMDVVRRDRSVLDFLFARDTFVNSTLARHYGMPDTILTRERPHPEQPNEWVQVVDARPYERGGLLPMSVFLTKNAPGLRTSPVKRGYWVARRLLGEQIPPPPPTVPELPNDETKLGDLTVRDALARHRADQSCAGCHARFDALGLVFEGFGPVGERREKDFAGRPVDTHATFPGGGEGTGLDGLRRYLRDQRQDEFLDNLCRKLLAFALGRSVLLSDDALIEDMRAKLAANGHRFSTLVETIITSRQFLTQRADDTLAGVNANANANANANRKAQ